MWNHVDSGRLDENALDLYERHGVYMIRVNGWELMNGECHESEDALGKLAAALIGERPADILLGGLGLGYTLASLIDNLRGPAEMTVADISAAVLRWFKLYREPCLPVPLPDGVRLVNDDVGAFLGAGRLWDLIILDVDNGPQPLSTLGNGMLYSRDGLSRCWASLRPAGVLLVWSSFEDPAFEDRARAAGFTVTVRPIAIAGRPEPFHYIFILARPAGGAGRSGGRVEIAG